LSEEALFLVKGGLDFLNKRYYYICNNHFFQLRDTIMSIMMTTPHEMLKVIAQKSKGKRLFLNFSQMTLSERSGVSHGVIKKFETTGKISLESLLRLALTLDALDEFHDLFPALKPEVALSLDDLMRDNTRKRGRK
jgi:hypothetical protein